MAIRFWLTHPRMFFHRLRYWLWERLNPGKPWLCPGTVRFCELHLKKSMAALEFGSGRSTRWFSSQVRTLTSVEHDVRWSEQVRAGLAKAHVNNVDYRLIALNHPEAEPERSQYHPVPDYVAVADGFADASLDLIIVDGHYRTHCILHAVPKLAPGGFLLVDDINLWPSPDVLPIPPSWRIVDDSANGLKRCIVWRAV